MVQLEDSKGKAVASEDPNVDDQFISHQNSHRPIKEPVKISPVVSVSLPKNPLPAPTDDKPSLLMPLPPPRPPKRGRMEVSKYPRAGGGGAYPYAKRSKKERIIKASFGEEEEVNSYDTNKGPTPTPTPGGAGNHFLEHPQFDYHRLYMKETSLIQALTMDLLREWTPITGFRDHRPNSAPAPAHSGASSSSSNEEVDLELNL